MKKSIILLLLLVGLPLTMVAQNVNDDLYFVPQKQKKEKVKVENKSLPSSVKAEVVDLSATAAPVKTVKKSVKKNGRDIDEYNRHSSMSSDNNYSDALSDDDSDYRDDSYDNDGEWIGGFDGSQEDYEFATRIVRFRNPRFAVSISSPFYWDIVYGLNSWEWNVYVDNYYAYAFPTFSNRLWWDRRFNSIGWGWSSPYYYGALYSPWYYTGWYSPWYSPYHYGWSYGWHYGWGGPGPLHYAWYGGHYRPENRTFRGQPGYTSNYVSGLTSRGNSGNVVRGSNGSVRTVSSTQRQSSASSSSVRRVVGTRDSGVRDANSSVSSSRSRSNVSTGTSSSSSRSSVGTTRTTTGTSGSSRYIRPSNSTTSRSSVGVGNRTTGVRSSTSGSSSRSVQSYGGSSSSRNSQVRSNNSSSYSRSSSSSSSRSYSSGSSFGGGSSRSSGGSFSGGGSSRSSGGGSSRSR